MTKKKTEVRRLREKVRSQKQDIEYLETELREVRDDLSLHRKHFEQYYKWFVRCLRDSSTPNLSHGLRDMAEKLSRMKPWYWSAGE